MTTNIISEEMAIARDMLYRKYDKMFLNKEEAAKELDVGRATVDRMRQNGQLKSSSIRGSIKFSLIEIAKFIK